MRAFPSTRVRVRIRTLAGLALAALLGGGVLPLLDGALAAETASFCGSKGRCCCARDSAAADEQPCLRRGCSCERPDASGAFGPIGLDAVLPASLPAHVEPRAAGVARIPAIAICRPHAPPVPPPRRALPA